MMWKLLSVKEIAEALEGYESYVDGFEKDCHGRVHILLRKN